MDRPAFRYDATKRASYMTQWDKYTGVAHDVQCWTKTSNAGKKYTTCKDNRAGRQLRVNKKTGARDLPISFMPELEVGLTEEQIRDGWLVFTSKKKKPGRKYYKNTKTGKKTYTKPGTKGKKKKEGFESNTYI